MKTKYYFLGLLAITQTIAHGKQSVAVDQKMQDIVEKRRQEVAYDNKESDVFESQDAFGERDVFKKQGKNAFKTPPIDISDLKNFKEEKNYGGLLISEKGNNPKVTPTRLGNTILTGEGDAISVNGNVLGNDTYRDCILSAGVTYYISKRYTPTELVFPEWFLPDSNLPRPPYYKDLNDRDIEIFDTIFGTNGGGEGAPIGLLAYRKKEPVQPGEIGHIEIFIVFEGSQGESFEFLGGFGGASWLTNLQADKVEVNSEELGLDKKYGKLSFHKGYYNKIKSSIISIESELISLFSHLGIKNFNKYQTSSTHVTQDTIDHWRGYSIDCYVIGHSQGGGLAQIGAPYVANFIGKFLYGESFNNATFNIVHVICLCPARACGNNHTISVILLVLGKGNIIAVSSCFDLVTVLPPGENADGKPVEKLAAKALLKIAGLIGVFLPKDWSNFISAISKTKFGYTTLPIFAYIEPFDILKKYCEIGTKVYNDYLKSPKPEKERAQIQSEIKKLGKIEKRVENGDIKKIVTSMYDNYLKAQANIKNFFKFNFFIAKTINELRKLLGIVPPGIWISAQHWGAPVKLTLPYTKETKVEQLFCADLVERDLSKSLKRGLDESSRKRAILDQ